MCEEEICVFAKKIIQSNSPKFLSCEYIVIEKILQFDELACEEQQIFNACIAWAKAACIRNNQDPGDVTNIRTQLGNSIYQIRFSSLTMPEFETCIRNYPGLLTANELHEIVCMIGKIKKYKQKQFN